MMTEELMALQWFQPITNLSKVSLEMLDRKKGERSQAISFSHWIAQPNLPSSLTDWCWVSVPMVKRGNISRKDMKIDNSSSRFTHIMNFRLDLFDSCSSCTTILFTLPVFLQVLVSLCLFERFSFWVKDDGIMKRCQSIAWC